MVHFARAFKNDQTFEEKTLPVQINLDLIRCDIRIVELEFGVNTMKVSFILTCINCSG